MIPFKEYTVAEFQRLFPRETTGNQHPILNDVPSIATSCVVYDTQELRKHCNDGNYVTPTKFPGSGSRGLKSCQAVYRTASDEKVVFSHMMISPEDVSKFFKGSDIVEKLTAVQTEVPHFPDDLLIPVGHANEVRSEVAWEIRDSMRGGSRRQPGNLSGGLTSGRAITERQI